MSIKYVGNQTFLSSKTDEHKVVINLAHIVDVKEREGKRDYTEEESNSDVTLTEEELKLVVFEIETTKGSFYFSSIAGRVAVAFSNSYWSTYVDSSLMSELEELFF